MVTTPVLAAPDPSLPYIIHCDASSHAIGAVLSQVDPTTGKERTENEEVALLSALAAYHPLFRSPCYKCCRPACTHSAAGLSSSASTPIGVASTYLSPLSPGLVVA